MNVREQRKANQQFEINFDNHEILLNIKTGYIQTDEGGVNTQYKSNKKTKDGSLWRCYLWMANL